MKVVFSPIANRDLRRITEYIGRDNPERATSFSQELYASCLSVGQMPRRHAFGRRLEKLGLRRKNHGSYAILYRESETRVEIVRVLHGARDLTRIFAAD